MPRWAARVALVASLVLASAAAHAAQALRIGTTPVFLDDQAAFLSAWGRYIEARLSRPVQFVQRGSYREITELMRSGELDLAWVCSPPYLGNRDRMALAVVPVYRGKPLYQSYLIVPAADTTTRGFADLKGAVYAFSDPDSNSGWLAPQVEMRRANVDGATLFKRTFFTWSHKKVVEAVAVGLAQGGSVDGYVWDTLALTHPEITSRTRVAWRSPWYGFPPIVARSDLPAQELRRLQDLFIGMKDDAEGRTLLRRLNLDGFIREDGRLFESVDQNLKNLRAARGG